MKMDLDKAIGEFMYRGADAECDGTALVIIGKGLIREKTALENNNKKNDSGITTD